MKKVAKTSGWHMARKIIKLMRNKIVMLFKVIIISVLVFAANISVAEISKTKVCLTGNTECSVAAELFEFKFSNDMVLDNKLAGSKKYFNVLNEYYILAKKNDLANIVKLYSELDGSRNIVEKSVRKVPNRYARFHKVGKIKVNKIYRFGAYYMVGVVWFDKQDQFLANWTELVHCPADCYMSERLMRKNEEVSFYSYASSGANKLTGSLKGSDVIKVEYPEGSEYPAKVSLGLSQYNTLSSEKKKKFTIVLNLINSLKANNSQIIKTSGGDSLAWRDMTIGFMQPYWANFGAQVMYYYPNKLGSEVLFSTLTVNRLADRLSKVEHAKPIALINGEEVSFLLMSVGLKEDRKVLQFYLSENNKIISQADLTREDGLLARLLQHPFVYEKLLKIKAEGASDLAKDLAPYKRDINALKDALLNSNEVDIHQDTEDKVIESEGSFLKSMLLKVKSFFLNF